MRQLPKPNHKSIIDDDDIEWLLSGMWPDSIIAMMRRRARAEYLGQKSVTRYLDKLIRGWAANNGRWKAVFEIAKNEEAITVASEAFAPRRGV